MRSLFPTAWARDWLVWGWLLFGATAVLASLAELLPTVNLRRDPDWALVATVVGRLVLGLVVLTLVVVVVAFLRGELTEQLSRWDARAVGRQRAAVPRATRPAAGRSSTDPTSARVVRRAAPHTDLPDLPDLPGLPGLPDPAEQVGADADAAGLRVRVPTIRSVELPVMPQVRLVARVDVASTSLPSVRDAVEEVLGRHDELDPPPLPPLPPLGVPSALLRRLDSAWAAVGTVSR